MNIFNVIVIPVVIALFFLLKQVKFEKGLLYSVLGAFLIASLLWIYEFILYKTIHQLVEPSFGYLYGYSLLRETLIPILTALLFYWLLRGSFWKKNLDISLGQLLLYFGTIFFILGIGENLYNRFDTDLYQVIYSPLQRLILVFGSAFILNYAEKMANRVSALFIALTIPVFASLFSLSYALFYSLNGVYLLVTIPLLLLVPLMFIIFDSELKDKTLKSRHGPIL